MTNLDAIFTKNNLEESKKKAKMLFGRLLISLRKSNHIKLYSLLESVEESGINEDKLLLTLSDKVAYEMINNINDIGVLNDALKELKSGLSIDLKCSGKEELDIFKFEERLKKEFGKILTIKKQ